MPSTRRVAGKNLRQKECEFDAGAVWWNAVCDSHDELEKHFMTAKKDQLRFQNCRLLDKLWQRIKETGKDELLGFFWCYRFITDMSGHGYDEAWRLHCEEMEAAGSKTSPRSFCSSAARLHANNPAAFVLELGFRIESIALWMDAQGSFSQWLVFKHCRGAWRGEETKRARAMQAAILATLPQHLRVTKFRRRNIKGAHLWEGLGIGADYDNKPWNARQWSMILEQAARLAEKSIDCTLSESWLWWCYPVFKRYDWNTREVKEAAIGRGFTEFAEANGVYEQNFRRHLMSMGLRISGRKQKRKRTAPLADFVQRISLPRIDKTLGRVIWY